MLPSMIMRCQDIHTDMATIVLINSLRPRHNGHHLSDDVFNCIFVNENARISLKISLKLVPEVRIYNIPSLVPIMAWRRPVEKPLSEPMLVNQLTHICVTRPQWVNVSSIDNTTALHITSLYEVPKWEYVNVAKGVFTWIRIYRWKGTIDLNSIHYFVVQKGQQSITQKDKGLIHWPLLSSLSEKPINRPK